MGMIEKVREIAMWTRVHGRNKPYEKRQGQLVV